MPRLALLALCPALLAAAPLPLPTSPQLAWQRGEIMALVHFNMATFFEDGDPGCTGSNWLGAQGSNNVNSFSPSALNVSQWVDSMIAVGAKEAVLTAKHGCGFYLWPTTVTLPDGTPYRYHVNTSRVGNVLAQFVAATSARGLGHGFYYSLTNNFYLNVRSHVVQPPSTLLPGQANVTQDEFEAIAFASVKELWTQYGNLTEIWFDGGYSGSMKAELTALLLEAQPNAIAFGGEGISPNPVRWCGAESSAAPPGWPNVFSTDCGTGGGGCPANTPGAVWSPSGADSTLQVGDHWFFQPNFALRSLPELISFYHASVGANAVMELDFAIDRTGQLHASHVAAYAAFGAWIRSCYGNPLATISPAVGANTALLSFASPTLIDRVQMREDLAFSQLVSAYTVTYQASAGGPWLPFSSGVAVGNKRIDIAPAPITVVAVLWTVTAQLAAPLHLETFAAFAPESCALPSSLARFKRNGQCLVSNSSSQFPCPGGAGNACPVFLGSCDDPTSVWDDALGTLINPTISTPSQAAGINVDCNADVPHTVVKLLRAGGLNPFVYSSASGTLMYTASSGVQLCLNDGDGPLIPPCGGEQHIARQVQVVLCTDAAAQGWVREAV